MKQSTLFTKTRKEAPKDEVSKNAELLIRAGFIHKEMAGVYSFLPLGLRVLKKIENIIREEINLIGGQEVSMTALQSKDVWEKTNRWSDDVLDVWFKTKLKNGGELGLATTHEEPLTSLLSEYVSSYKDLPLYVYQFQTKFRNETRAKSGILRGREFLMKDLYSFSATKEEHDAFYKKAEDAYCRIYGRVGLGENTFKTFALGGSFSKYSHEFQTITDAGEDSIYIDTKKGIAVNEEAMLPEVLDELGLSKDVMEKKTAVEVGNIFSLADKFSKPLNLVFKNDKGESVPVYMGCYGIGLSRLMGTVAEVLSDKKGLVWPKSIAPFAVHIVSLGSEDGVIEKSKKLYEKLTFMGVEVLWDERDLRAGEKFADSDLLGIPLRVVVSSKTLESEKFEIKERTEEDVSMVTEEELLAKFAK